MSPTNVDSAKLLVMSGTGGKLPCRMVLLFWSVMEIRPALVQAKEAGDSEPEQ